MRNNFKQRKQEGFTIIEVLIVLAIAGLILLVVFMAVPALQRNSRNTQAKNEASTLVGAINEWQGNNSGKNPGVGASGTASTDDAAIFPLANSKTLTSMSVIAYATTTDPTETNAVLVKTAKCSNPSGANAAGVLTGGLSDRESVLLYSIEGRSARQVACVQV